MRRLFLVTALWRTGQWGCRGCSADSDNCIRTHQGERRPSSTPDVSYVRHQKERKQSRASWKQERRGFGWTVKWWWRGVTKWAHSSQRTSYGITMHLKCSKRQLLKKRLVMGEDNTPLPRLNTRAHWRNKPIRPTAAGKVTVKVRPIRHLKYMAHW